jgi:hypothetical protein
MLTGMKFVQTKETTSTHAVVGRSYWSKPPGSSDDFPSRLKIRTWTCDFNASFSSKETKLCQLVQANVD